MSATSVDSVGQSGLPLFCSFGLQHAAIRAYPDHSVSSRALQPYWLDSAYKFGFGAGRRSSPRADVKTLREWKFCDEFFDNEREESVTATAIFWSQDNRWRTSFESEDVQAILLVTCGNGS